MKNPIASNWYADPESRVYGDTVYSSFRILVYDAEGGR